MDACPGKAVGLMVLLVGFSLSSLLSQFWEAIWLG